MDANLRAVFDNTVQLMAVLTPDGVVVDVNRALLELCGLRAEDLVGHPFRDAACWSDADALARVTDAIARAAAGESVRSEIELATAAGNTACIDLSIRPVRDGSGHIGLLISEGRDITESKWALDALRESEAKFAGIISIASDAIISVDEQGRITLFNQGAETIFGHAAADMIGQRLDILLPERFRAAHGKHMHNFAASPTAARRMGERQEILGRRSDGTEFPAEASISKLELSGARMFTVVLRDISDRKRIERAQRFLARAGTILASSLDYEQTLSSVAGLTVPELADWSVVYVREDDGSVRRLEVAHADAALQPVLNQLLQFPLDPHTPHPVFAVLETGQPEVMPETDRAFLEALSQSPEHLRVYETLGLASLMVVPLTAHGQTRGAMGYFSVSPRRYGADELALAQDLALVSALAVENARLYRDAQAAVRARDDMIAVVSHDLGNPLSAIRIGTSLLLRSVPPEQQASGGWQHLEFIRQSAQQMENLINDLLDVKRLEAGLVTLQQTEVEAHDVVEDVLGVLGPIARGQSVDLEWVPVGPLPAAHVDRQRLAQILSNLIGNAIKFTAPGGRVSVQARAVARSLGATDQALLFTVSDTGIGIPEEHLPHIFDRFWQLRKEGKKGLGLGLSIARGLVEAHGGRIWCESAVGSGSTFLFTMPAARLQTSGPPEDLAAR